MIKTELPLPPVVDLASGNVTIPKKKEAVFLVKKSVLENVPPILFLKTALTEIISTVFLLKCCLKLSLASS